MDELSKLVPPEPWRFKKLKYKTKNAHTAILGRYLHTIFRKQSIEFNSERDDLKAAKYFHVENESACFTQNYIPPIIKGFMPTLSGTTRGIP